MKVTTLSKPLDNSTLDPKTEERWKRRNRKTVEKRKREKKKSVREIDEGWLKVQDDVVNI